MLLSEKETYSTLMGFGEQANASGFDPDMVGALPTTPANYCGVMQWLADKPHKLVVISSNLISATIYTQVVQ